MKKKTKIEIEKLEEKFTDNYKVGEIIYYTYENELTNNKEVYELTITKVYPKVIIGSIPRENYICIDIKDKDKIFRDRYEAEREFKWSNNISP